MPAAFTIVFTPAGGEAVTLADVAAKHTAVIHTWGGMAVEDVEQMFEQAAALRLLLGNVAGDFVFTSQKAAASRGAMLAYFMAQRGLINRAGQLVVTIDGVVAAMSNATCRGVEPAGFDGVRWPLKYTFGITLIDPAPDFDPGAPGDAGGGPQSVPATDPA
jgi:hypothetical protein